MTKAKRRPPAQSARHEHSEDIPTESFGSPSLLSWLRDTENLFFVALVAALLIPIWRFQYFPSQDGPDYLQNANIIRSYGDPGFQLVREYYLVNKSLTPNWALHAILAALMTVSPALIAEKILLSGYVILLPLSVRYALVTIEPQSRFLVMLILPFVYNSLFHHGFYGFSYSLALFFFVVGYWLKHRDAFDRSKAAKLSILILLLYFSHPTSFVASAVAVFFLLGWTVVFNAMHYERRAGYDFRSALRGIRITALATVCAFIPALVMIIIFLFQQGTERLPPWPFKMLLTFLPYMSLISFSATEAQLAVAFFCFFALMIVGVTFVRLRGRRLSYSDAGFALGVIYLLMYFTSPKALSGGGLIEQRLVLFPFFAFILWFAGQSFSRVAKLGTQLIAVAITAALLVSYWTKYAELNDYLAEYLSGMQMIEPNKTLLPLCISHRQLPDGETLSVAVSPFVHAAGYMAAQKQIVVLDNHEADTTYFPVLYRPERNPNHHIGRALNSNTPYYSSTLEAQPPEVDILTYAQRTGGRVDYVLVWAGGKTLARSDRKVASIYQQLKEGYALIYESPRWGLMQLYKIKE